jgi:predicted flap endonuclease-1-like 5' DNA nuclease
MFEKWNFLLAEIWVLLAIAALLGLLIGAWIYGRKARLIGHELDMAKTDMSERNKRINSLQGQMSAREASFDKEIKERNIRIAELEADLSSGAGKQATDIVAAKASIAERDKKIRDLQAKLTFTQSGAPDDTLRNEMLSLKDANQTKERKIAELEAELRSRSNPRSALASNFVKAGATAKNDPSDERKPGAFVNPVFDAPPAGTKPATLGEARGGQPDDLKQIKGVGPKLEKLLHSLGFFHFDQVASWTEAEEAWVDQNLEGFSGRVSRDDWISQARILAAGGSTEFSDKVDKDDIY